MHCHRIPTSSKFAFLFSSLSSANILSLSSNSDHKRVQTVCSQTLLGKIGITHWCLSWDLCNFWKEACAQTQRILRLDIPPVGAFLSTTMLVLWLTIFISLLQSSSAVYQQSLSAASTFVSTELQRSDDDWDLNKPLTSNSTANLVFATISSLLQSAPNLRYRNGWLVCTLGVIVSFSSRTHTRSRYNSFRNFALSWSGWLKHSNYGVGGLWSGGLLYFLQAVRSISELLVTYLQSRAVSPDPVLRWV